MRHSRSERRIEPLDMLRTPNPVQRPEYYIPIHPEAIRMADRVQVRCRQAVPQAMRAQRVSIPHEASHDLPSGAVHGKPDPDGTLMMPHERA